jgi:hypothetical protein
MKATDIRFEHRELLIQRLTSILNYNNVWEDFKRDITFDKILEDNNIDVWD